MVIGSYFWGCLADTRGRRTVLVATLIMDGICGLASSVSQYFYVFMFFRFCNGFAWVLLVWYAYWSSSSLRVRSFEFIARFKFFLVLFSSITGAMGILFPYLGEFQPTKYREKILCWLELFWTVGIIALPGTRLWHLYSTFLYITVLNFIFRAKSWTKLTKYFRKKTKRLIIYVFLQSILELIFSFDPKF